VTVSVGRPQEATAIFRLRLWLDPAHLHLLECHQASSVAATASRPAKSSNVAILIPASSARKVDCMNARSIA